MHAQLRAANQPQDIPFRENAAPASIRPLVLCRVETHPGPERAGSTPPDPNWLRLAEWTRSARRAEREGDAVKAAGFRLACKNLRRTIRLRTAQEFAAVIDNGAA